MNILIRFRGAPRVAAPANRTCAIRFLANKNRQAILKLFTGREFNLIQFAMQEFMVKSLLFRNNLPHTCRINLQRRKIKSKSLSLCCAMFDNVTEFGEKFFVYILFDILQNEKAPQKLLGCFSLQIWKSGDFFRLSSSLFVPFKCISSRISKISPPSR
jgi:hypothetical protein